MSTLITCATCGGLVPAEQRCCPHCHCRTPHWKRWLVVGTAALGAGAASCGPVAVPMYGAAIQRDAGDSDTGAPDAGTPDAGEADGGPDGG